MINKTKTKIIWAAMIVPEDKEVLMIEPVRVKCKNSFGEVNSFTISGQITDTETFLEKMVDLADTAQQVFSDEKKA